MRRRAEERVPNLGRKILQGKGLAVRRCAKNNDETEDRDVLSRDEHGCQWN
jgi:hypothetical protein